MNTGETGRDVDRRILETILRTIRANKAPLMLAEREDDFVRLLAYCGTAEYHGDLWTFLNEHPQVGRDALMVTVRKMLEFTDAEATKYSAIKSKGPLTEDEKRYGNENTSSAP